MAVLTKYTTKWWKTPNEHSGVAQLLPIMHLFREKLWIPFVETYKHAEIMNTILFKMLRKMFKIYLFLRERSRIFETVFSSNTKGAGRFGELGRYQRWRKRRGPPKNKGPFSASGLAEGGELEGWGRLRRALSAGVKLLGLTRKSWYELELGAGGGGGEQRGFGAARPSRDWEWLMRGPSRLFDWFDGERVDSGGSVPSVV